MDEESIEFEYIHYNDGPDIPVAENPHFFALIRFLGLISNTNMAIDWTFDDVQNVFDNEELTDYSRNLHLKLLGFLGKRFPPHVTLERNLSKFLDERPTDVNFIFWDRINDYNSNSVDKVPESNVTNKSNQEETDQNQIKQEFAKNEKNSKDNKKYKNNLFENTRNNNSSENLIYNPYRDNEYKYVKKYERLRTIRILINSCIQESKQLRQIFQNMENYSLKCKNPVPGECFFGQSPPYIGDDQLGYHYWYINLPNDEAIFRLYRESSENGELTLLSDNSDTLCNTFKTFLNDGSLQEIGKILEIKYNSLVVAEKAKLRKIRQMRSIRNQLESSWGNCAPTDEMLSGGRLKRKTTINIDYSYSRNDNATRRSARINKQYNHDDFYLESNHNNIVKDRSNRLAMRNAKKQQIEEIEKDNHFQEMDYEDNSSYQNQNSNNHDSNIIQNQSYSSLDNHNINYPVNQKVPIVSEKQINN